jgi:outer membrane protein assembly factor BamB
MQCQNVQSTSRGVASPPNGLLQWSVSAPFSIEGPVVAADGTIYCGCGDWNLYAFNPNGTLKWKCHTGGQIQGTPAIGDDGTLYVGTSDDSSIYAISPQGSVKWKFSTSSSGISTVRVPVVAPNGTIYAGSDNGYFFALNSSGKKLWSYYTGDREYSPASVGSDGTVYVPCWNHTLYALTSLGRLKWTFYENGSPTSAPLLAADGSIYIASLDGSLYGLNPNGSMKWHLPIGGSDLAEGPDGTLYSPWNDVIYAISPSGLINWCFADNNQSVFGRPIIAADGSIYTFSAGTENTLYALSGNGALKWTFPIAAQASARMGAIGSNGTFYFSDFNNGRVYAVGIPSTVPAAFVSASPAGVPGGLTSTGTVTLSQSVKAGGDLVTLTSSSPDVIVPASILVKAGNSVSFPITTKAVTSTITAVITATSGGNSVKASLPVVPMPSQYGFTFYPSQVAAGNASWGTVCLATPAPSGGVSFSITYDAGDGQGVSFGNSLEVLPGALTCSNTAFTAGEAIGSYGFRVFYDSNPSQGFSPALKVVAASLTALAVYPSQFVGGTQQTGMVFLNGLAGPNGVTVQLSSSNLGLTVPQSVKVLANNYYATFPITTKSVSSAYSATISAVQSGTPTKFSETVKVSP